MTPSYFVAIASLPLTANGKLDRAALPDPSEAQNGIEVARPGNAIEEDLLKIWSDVLGKTDIGTDRNFFDIGGDSIKLIKVSSNIIRRFKCKIQIRSEEQ